MKLIEKLHFVSYKLITFKIMKPDKEWEKLTKIILLKFVKINKYYKMYNPTKIYTYKLQRIECFHQRSYIKKIIKDIIIRILIVKPDL